MIASLAALAAGGIAGTLARRLVWLAALPLGGARFPLGTLAVNLTGCFLAGYFDAAARSRGLGGANGRLLLVTSFCGAYTTLSAMVLELDVLLRASPAVGAAYAAGTVLAGLALLRMGAALGG